MTRRAVRAKLVETLRFVQLDPERVMGAYPHELSGGMRQRVLLALALLLDAQVLILDEPTTALDIMTQRTIINLLRQLKEEQHFTMIFISHDLAIAAELADRIGTMYAGRLVELGASDDLFYQPRHPYTLGLIRAVPTVTGGFEELESIPGSPPDLINLPPGCSFHPRCSFATDICKVEEPPLESVGRPIRWRAGTGAPSKAIWVSTRCTAASIPSPLSSGPKRATCHLTHCIRPAPPVPGRRASARQPRTWSTRRYGHDAHYRAAQRHQAVWQPQRIGHRRRWGFACHRAGRDGLPGRRERLRQEYDR